ncbi:MAG TPA: flagellar type III secretion system pore protein FliP [Kofleriaceae bacterium]
MDGLENAALIALVAIVPLVVLTLTSFVKVSVVLSLLRNAIGAPDAPSGLIVMGLSLVLTFFVMAPVAVDMVQAAAGPSAPQQPGPPQPAPEPPAPSTDRSVEAALRMIVPAQYQPQLAAAQRAVEPLRAFLAKHTRDADRETFASLAKKLGSSGSGEELWVLAPAFITTELREAFVIAILIFIPFLVIDLVVGLGLASLGLQSTSPQTIALPLKLVLFVAVDGWRLLIDALLRGYA